MKQKFDFGDKKYLIKIKDLTRLSTVNYGETGPYNVDLGSTGRLILYDITNNERKGIFRRICDTLTFKNYLAESDVGDVGRGHFGDILGEYTALNSLAKRIQKKSPKLDDLEFYNKLWQVVYHTLVNRKN